MSPVLQENPALEKAPTGSPRPAGPCVMVIFGATGDLTGRKLMPALYNLARSRLLSEQFAVIGVSRNDYSLEQFRQMMEDKLQSFTSGTLDAKLRSWLIERIYYVSGEFDDPALYTRLSQALADVDLKHHTRSNYFFYLATSPVFFGKIADQLGQSELA